MMRKYLKHDNKIPSGFCSVVQTRWEVARAIIADVVKVPQQPPFSLHKIPQSILAI